MTETFTPWLRMPSSNARVAWLDHETDWQQTGSVHSRYGAILRKQSVRFRMDGRISHDSGHFTAMAWQLATTPQLGPPFLRLHPRVLKISAAPIPNQGVTMSGDLVSTLPDRVRLLLPRGTHGWLKENGQYAAPASDPDSLTVLPVLTVEVAIPSRRLPMPAYERGAPDRATAIESLEVVCDTLATVFGPILEILRHHTGSRQRSC